MGNLQRIILFACAYVLAVSGAEAHDWNFNQPVCGTTAVGMAGAFTAVSDDASAICYNPAGMALMVPVKSTSSASTYETTMERYYDVINSGDLKFSSTGVKGYFGGVTRDPILFKNVSMGGGLFVPKASEQHQSFEFDAPSISVHSAKFYSTKSSLERIAMFAVSTRSDDGLAFGGALGLMNQVSKTSTYSSGELFDSANSKTLVVSQGVHMSSEYYGLLYRLGVIKQWSASWNLGLTISYGVGLRQKSEFERQAFSAYATGPKDEGSSKYPANSISIASQKETGGMIYQRLPLRTRMGAAFKTANKWLFSGDLQHTVPPVYGGNGYDENTKPVYDIAVGGQHKPTDYIKYAFGIFTNFDSRREVYASDGPQHATHTDEYGTTGAITLLDETSEYSLSWLYMNGRGYGEVISASSEIAMRRSNVQTFQITAGLSTSM